MLVLESHLDQSRIIASNSTLRQLPNEPAQLKLPASWANIHDNIERALYTSFSHVFTEKSAMEKLLVM